MIEVGDSSIGTHYWVDSEKKAAGIHSRNSQGEDIGVLLIIEFPTKKPYFVNGVPLVTVNTKRQGDLHGILSVYNPPADSRQVDELVLDVLRGYKLEAFGH